MDDYFLLLLESYYSKVTIILLEYNFWPLYPPLVIVRLPYPWCEILFCFILFKSRFLTKSKSLEAINTFMWYLYAFKTWKRVTGDLNTSGGLIKDIKCYLRVCMCILFSICGLFLIPRHFHERGGHQFEVVFYYSYFF